MGWAAAFGSLSLAPVLLYVAAVAWTVGYDTIYALQDIEDDEMAASGPRPGCSGDKVGFAVAVCYGIARRAARGVAAARKAGPAAWPGRRGFAAHLAWQVRMLEPRDGERALRLFRANRDAGLILFAGLSLDALVRARLAFPRGERRSRWTAGRTGRRPVLRRVRKRGLRPFRGP